MHLDPLQIMKLPPPYIFDKTQLISCLLHHLVKTRTILDPDQFSLKLCHELYLEPDETSKLIDVITWSKDGIDPNTINAQDLFVVYLPEENKGFLAVAQENEDWIQVIYNNSTGDMAWVKKDVSENYMSWENFFDLYGKKYGLKILNGTNNDEKTIYAQADEYSKVVGKVYKLQKINLHGIKGNWASVTVTDINDVSKTGYVKWRSERGIKYFFPDIP